jgi:hypothetical protein
VVMRLNTAELFCAINPPSSVSNEPSIKLSEVQPEDGLGDGDGAGETGGALTTVTVTADEFVLAPLLS